MLTANQPSERVAPCWIMRPNDFGYFYYYYPPEVLIYSSTRTIVISIIKVQTNACISFLKDDQ